MAESYQDKLDNFSRGRSFLKLRGGVPNSTGELCAACGSGQPGTLFGIRELLTGLDHFVGYNCLQELIRMKAVLQGRVRETTEEAFNRAQRSKEAMAKAELKPDNSDDQSQLGRGNPRLLSDKAEATLNGSVFERLNGPGPSTTPVIATPTLVVWETEDAFRAAVQVQGHDGLATVWGAAEQPKWRQVLTIHTDKGFILTKEERYDWAALARCVRLATRNA